MARVGIIGVAGRMGRTLIEAIAEHPDVTLGAAFESEGSDVIGLDAGLLAGGQKLGVEVADKIADKIDDFDVIIDFSRPAGTLAMLSVCSGQNKGAVVGTTGFSASEKEKINNYAQNMPIMQAANMSVGVNLCLNLLEKAATVLGDDYDVEIVEAHHRYKVDAPSGTALAMGEVVAEALGRDLNECAVYGREGNTGERDKNTIGFETIRGGDIVGEHTVMFAGLGERVEIVHKASSRMTFARGAIRAAVWLASRDKGLYDMRDVLDLK